MKKKKKKKKGGNFETLLLNMTRAFWDIRYLKCGIQSSKNVKYDVKKHIFIIACIPGSQLAK